MLRAFRPALTLILLLTVLTGLVLPLAMTGIGQLAFPFQANGSLLHRQGAVIGSALLGQNFTADQYFHPRPSATTETDPKDATKTIAVPYAADNSAGSNLGPSSKALLDRVRTDIANPGVAGAGPGAVPADAVTTSASGLDPDISPENAARQVARIAAARHLPVAQVQAVLDAHVRGRWFGFIGEPRVNVLATNLALDAAAGH